MKDATVSARVECGVKAEAEDILQRLGIPVSVVINSLYRQIVFRRGVPFPLTIPAEPKTLDVLTDAELNAKQAELTHFAEAQGLDPKAEAVANAIQNVDYAALIAEVTKNGKPGAKPQVASYAMGGISARGEYDDLLEKA